MVTKSLSGVSMLHWEEGTILSVSAVQKRGWKLTKARPARQQLVMPVMVLP
jgi:hypothetical protein